MDQTSQRSQEKDRHALDASTDQGVADANPAAAVHRAINVAGLDHLVVGAHDAARAAAAGAAGSATAAAEEVDLKPIGAAGRHGRRLCHGARHNRLDLGHAQLTKGARYSAILPNIRFICRGVLL